MTLSSFVPLREIDPEATRSLPDDLELLVSNLTIDQIVARQFNFVDSVGHGEMAASAFGSASISQMREAADLVDLESSGRS